MRSVVLYHATDCHLCDGARDVLIRTGVPFDEIDISGDPELEARYREWLPVVEIDGERAFVYYVDEAALRRRIARWRSSSILGEGELTRGGETALSPQRT
jgi:glutaredoxin